MNHVTSYLICSVPRKEIFKQIEEERTYQDRKWGTSFDDKNTLNDWVTYIILYLAWAAKMNEPKASQRLAMVKVAALAVAALETFDRNNGFAPRHFDK